MKITSFMMFLFISMRAFAVNYYLSGKGNDLQSGTSALTPWQNLKKISEVMRSLQPGDSILFERGSVFEGELKLSVSGKPGHEIYIGAYGSGMKPIIRGSVEIKNWTIFRGNIWVAECSQCDTEPGNLFIDGQYQPLGRSPNQGYRTVSCNAVCKSSFQDNQLFADGYWNGAEVVVKSSRWTLDILPVSNYFNRTFYFSSGASYPVPNGNGYFVQKHLATLDTPGEWYFDKASKKIFLYANPGNGKVEVSVNEKGFEMQRSAYVRVENIVFRYQREIGISIKYSDHISLRNCEIEFAGSNGMEIASCQSATVENCRIVDSNNNGVMWSDNTDGTFVRNSIQRTGLQSGRAGSGNGTSIGLSITANIHKTAKNRFQYNSIDSTGYIGIDFRTGGNLIKNNVVSNFCMIKDDGAGIYTWGNNQGDNQIEENIIHHGPGCGAGTKDFDKVLVSGIYIDDRSNDIQINRNTVAYCGTTGIYIHNAKRIVVQGNILYANGSHLTNKEKGQLSIKLDNLVPWEDRKVLDLLILENTFIAMQEGNYCIYLQAEKEQELKSLGLFDRNLYRAVNPKQLISKFVAQQEMCMAAEDLNLADWQKEGNDMNSRFKAIPPAAVESVGPNMIKNSSMTGSAEGWISWPSGISMVLDKRTAVVGSSLKVQFPNDVKEVLLYSPGQKLKSNGLYRLSFSARSIKKSNMEFVPMMSSAPWEALGDYTCFSIDTVFRKFTYYFRPYRNHQDARVNFKCSATFWIDEVALSEIVYNPEFKKVPLEMIYNASEEPRRIPGSFKLGDLDGNPISEPFLLPGYHSIIVQKIP